MNAQKPKLYKRWWFVLVVGIVIGAGGFVAFAFFYANPQYLSMSYWNNYVYTATHKCLKVNKESGCVSDTAFPTKATIPYYFELRESDGKGGFTATGLNSNYLSSADVEVNKISGSPSVALYFNSAGEKLLETITARNIGKPLGFFVNNKLVMSPVVRDKISAQSVWITGNLTLQQATDMAKGLNAGIYSPQGQQ